MPPKRQRPLGPNPQNKPNWATMNEGQRRYAMEQWKLARVRRGERFEPPGEEAMGDEQYEHLMNFDLSVLGTPPEAGREPDLPTSQENQAADDFISELQNMNSEASSSNQAGPAPKRQKTEGPIDSTGSITSKGGTSLPGTGGNLGGMTEGRSNAPVAIFRPIGRHTEYFTQTFHKKWRFLTSANANVILNDVVATTPVAHPERWALTTALANIPWEYAFFYMTPAEYNRMIQFPGAKAKSCSITVKSWNTRVAFQTGDTQTSNATLNQNKFIQIGKGLRSVPYLASSDRQYSYDPTEPMKPTGFNPTTSAQHRDRVKTAMYGYDNDQPNITLAPPSDATGAEIYLRDYLTVYALKNNSTLKPGFPQLKNLIEEYDASACINQVVAALNYDFDYAPLTPNWPCVPNNLITDSNSVDLAAGNKIEGLMMKTVSPAQAATTLVGFNPTRKYLQGPNNNRVYFDEDQQYMLAPLEQAGIFEELNSRGYTDSQQPSLHVGIRAVPKLTTIDPGIQATSFLDAQGYFEVEAELIVESVDDYTHIKQGCFAPNTKGQEQLFIGARPASYTYDFPNVYGRMRPRALPAATK